MYQTLKKKTTTTTMAMPANPRTGRGRTTCLTMMAPWWREKSLPRESSCLWPDLPMFWDLVPNPWGWTTVQGCGTCCGGLSSNMTGLPPAVFSVLTWKEQLTTGLLSGIAWSFRYHFGYSVAFAFCCLFPVLLCQIFKFEMSWFSRSVLGCFFFFNQNLLDVSIGSYGSGIDGYELSLS